MNAVKQIAQQNLSAVSAIKNLLQVHRSFLASNPTVWSFSVGERAPPPNAIREYISRFTQICFLARMAQRESLYEGLEYHKI